MALLLAAVVALQVVRDRSRRRPTEAPPMLWLQSPEAARRMMLSFTDLAADVYWMRAVVHYGGERRSTDAPDRYALLYPLLDMATTLDPHFDVAARLGAIFLSEGYPGGPGRPDQALALLEKGLAHDPDRWQYRHDIGFVHYWWLKDYRGRGRAVRAGQPHARRARLAEDHGRHDLLARRRPRGGAQAVERAARHRRRRLDAARRRVPACGSCARSTTSTRSTRASRRPRRGSAGRRASWEEVVAAGALPGVPVDPAGVPYDARPRRRA